MIKDHSDRERRTHCSPVIGYLFLNSSTRSYTAPSHRQDGSYHGLLCYTNYRALAGIRNSSMGPPQGIDQTTHRTMSRSSTMELCFTPSHLTDAQVQKFYKAFVIWSEAEKTYSKKRPDWHDTVALTTDISPVIK